MAVSKLGILKQALASLSGAISVFMAGCWIGWPSSAVKMITEGETHLHITSDQISWIVALMDFGNIISPIPSGYLADSLGRKVTLLLSAFLYFTTWLLAVFGPSAPYLYAARIGAGMGKGLAYTVVPMYLGEIASVQVRGAISIIFICLLNGGILFEFIIGPFVSYYILNIISGVVPIVFFITFIFFPESPYYYLMKEHHDEAKKSLVWFRNAQETDESLVDEFNEMTNMVRKDMEERGSFADVVATAETRKALTIVVVLSAFQRFSGISSLLAYTVVTLPATGGYFRPEMYMIIFGTTLIASNLMSMPLIDMVGRKPMLLLSCAACALLTGISTLFYWKAGPENDTNYNWIAYLCFVGYGAAYSIGISIMPSTFVGELFPANVKGYASSISAMFYAIASFLTNKVYLFVQYNYGVQYMYGFFTLCSIIAFLFSLFVVFETKQLSLAQIQDKLSKNNKSSVVR